ncbi:DUF2911 domain-containing protein [Mesonia aestuariivivens]|uniref:DUF2911 domain-containing protein n=1 Tax=Mesonia aestuariivivens TaxID=2796128 RepID=A0ABS6W423_9FLAO|nr:DUF2911 domain-containing protein [Mesonia aestuariivivens]MBW2962595.1 DUF2911 domain-containing protein [Mesonia aestuariivivens]
MRKKVKWTVIILMVIVLGGVIGFNLWKGETKSYSPEGTANYQQGSLKVEVFYNRPFKKGRAIFGELVPYGQVWRTGANEATTIEVNKDILVDGSRLKSGKYTLWTIPNKDSWKIIFNEKMYTWGIDLTTKEAARDPKYDVLTLELPVHKNLKTVEQFTIYFDQQQNINVMYLAWDHSVIKIPFKEPEK